MAKRTLMMLLATTAGRGWVDGRIRNGMLIEDGRRRVHGGRLGFGVDVDRIIRLDKSAIPPVNSTRWKLDAVITMLTRCNDDSSFFPSLRNRILDADSISNDERLQRMRAFAISNFTPLLLLGNYAITIIHDICPFAVERRMMSWDDGSHEMTE